MWRTTIGSAEEWILRITLLLGDSMVTSDVAPFPGEVLKGSCSICAMSTIAHGVFGDPLWQQPNASAHRIKWLLELNNHEVSDISVRPASEFN